MEGTEERSQNSAREDKEKNTISIGSSQYLREDKKGFWSSATNLFKPLLSRSNSIKSDSNPLPTTPTEVQTPANEDIIVLKKAPSKNLLSFSWFRASATPKNVNPLLHMAALASKTHFEVDDSQKLMNQYWNEQSDASSIVSYDDEDELKLRSSLSTVSLCSDVAGCDEDEISMLNLKSTAEKLEIIFDLPKNETYITEFACWFVRSVLLKGYMYVTTNHICFYSSVPPITDSTLKSSFLQKLITRRPARRYRTMWFVLKLDGLYIYEDPTKLYYPSTTIYLKNVITVSKSIGIKNGIKLRTSLKNYTFKADTELQTNEWFDMINIAVFNSKNSGNDIKVVLPFQSISDISISKTEFSNDSIKITVVLDDPLGTEKYFFSYFNNVEKANETLNELLRKSRKKYSRPSNEKIRLLHSRKNEDRPPLEKSVLSNFTQKKSPIAVPNSAPLDSKYLDITYEPAELDQSYFQYGHRKSTSDCGGSSESTMEQKNKIFKESFAVPETENLITTFPSYLIRTLPKYGKIYISSNYLCFKSSFVGIRAKVVIPISDILNVEPGKQFSPFFFALTIKTKNYDEIYFDFTSIEDRKRFMETLDSLRQTATNAQFFRPNVIDRRRKSLVDQMVHQDLHVKATFSKDELSKIIPLVPLEPLKPTKLMHITCLTIGSRGDVQPYIALCLGLMKDGHTCRIATHLEFQPWIESFGIEFSLVKGDPSDLIQLCVDHDMFSVGFVREAYSKFLGWIDELLIGCSDAGKGTDMLIESPSCFGGIHVAEALGIYYFSAFPMPWTRTKAYPHPFGVPEYHMGGTYNLMTHVVIEEALGKALVPMINRWRKDTLGLEQIGYSLDNKKVPFLYSFSSSIVPHPSDWPDWVHICGYWFLDNSEQNWSPPDSLTKFLNDGPPPVYIGFGSIIVPDPDEMTRIILEAVKKSGVRAILSKGWSARAKDAKEKEPQKKIEYPQNIYPIEKVPHDWLFPLCAAVFHHGGAGTCAAGLRAGIPTLIKPFFGDQYFWADRVTDVIYTNKMGVGLELKKFTVNSLAKALTAITTDRKIKEKAIEIGKCVRNEDGVRNAINYIYRDMDYSLERVRHLANIHCKDPTIGTKRPKKSKETPIITVTGKENIISSL